MPYFDVLSKCVSKIFIERNIYLKPKQELQSVWHYKGIFLKNISKSMSLNSCADASTYDDIKMHQVQCLTFGSIYDIKIVRNTLGSLFLIKRISFLDFFFSPGHFNIAEHNYVNFQTDGHCIIRILKKSSITSKVTYLFLLTSPPSISLG